MELNIETNGICANLEKVYKGVNFNRSYKEQIRINVENFIRSKLHEYMSSNKTESPVADFEKAGDYLNSIVLYSEKRNKISISSISHLRSGFITKEKDNLLAAINPLYYTLDSTPKCLSEKNIVKSVKVAIGLAYYYYSRNNNRYNSRYKYNLNMLKFFKNEFPENFMDYEKLLYQNEECEETEKLINISVVYSCAYTELLQGYFNSDRSLKNTKEIREIRDNYELIIDKVDLVLNEDFFEDIFKENSFISTVHYNTISNTPKAISVINEQKNFHKFLSTSNSPNAVSVDPITDKTNQYKKRVEKIKEKTIWLLKNLDYLNDFFTEKVKNGSL